MREALTKAEELLMDLSPDERLVIGTAYCGQDPRTGEMLGLFLHRRGVDYFPLIIQEPPVIIPAAIHPSFSRLFYYMGKHPCVRRGMTDLAEGEV